MNEQPRFGLVGPLVMLISAAILGYFGFTPQFSHTSSITGQFLLFVAIYEYTLKVSSVAMLICAAATIVKPISGNILYGLCAVGCSGGLITAGVLDLADVQHTVQDPMLTFLFAVIILFAGINSVRVALAALQVDARREAGAGYDESSYS